MTDLPPLSPRDEDDIAAAEYVLGVGTLPDRLAAERRLQSEPAFAAAVLAWENRLAGLNDGYPDAPVPDLMPQIEARLFGQTAPRRPFWWTWLAGAVAAAALAAVVVAVLPMVSPQPSVPVAVLSGEGQDLRFDVARKGDQVTVTRVAGPGPATGKSHQLWLIVGENAPVPLGLVDDGSETVAVPALADGMVFAVSLEPAGGSPTGAPTGPILVTGKVAQTL